MAVELIAGEKAKGESKNAIIACNDWLRIGAGRSLPSLLKQYTESDQKQPPTLGIGALKKWSTSYHWQARAELYDAGIEAEKQAVERERQRKIADRRKSIMEDGVALDFERVDKLKKLAALLEEQIFYEPKVDEKAADIIGISALLGMAEETRDKEEISDIARLILAKLDPNDPKNKLVHLWAHDVKGLAGGRTVEVVRFNNALLAEFRAILDEIAKETGGRRQRSVNFNIDFSKLSDDQLERIDNGEDPVEVVLSGFVKD